MVETVFVRFARYGYDEKFEHVIPGRASNGPQREQASPVQLSATPSAQAASPRKDAPIAQNAQAALNLQVVVS